MAKVIVNATVSVDGFIADENDGIGPMFDWMGSGDVAVTDDGDYAGLRVAHASAEYIRAEFLPVRAIVVGRNSFDHANGWNGEVPGGEHLYVVTHEPPADWPYPDAAFTFVTDGVENAIAQAREFAGDGHVSVSAGDIGTQVIEAGLADEVHLELVPVLFGHGKRFFHEGGALRMLENPRVFVGERVTHLCFPIRK
ncbi:dihydrofolate reductase family protein [Actinophytocola sp.]|uniref:dihydrofolate reductase family protein n=1 Tax=Actinophytocola sp. TaxID=1872138 RepID=UPI002ED0C3EA